MMQTALISAGAMLFAGLAAGCGSDSDDTGSSTQTDAGSNDAQHPGFDPIPISKSNCNAVMQYHPIAAAPHVEQCSVIEYETNPPSSGPHYPSWAAFGEYDANLPRGFWVHSMEHGAVVVSYDCDNCSAEVTMAKNWLSQLPDDPVCAASEGPKNRAILVPDPKLLEPWAASAWGVTLVADCFEPEVFSEFYQLTHGKAPENFCTQGVELVGDDGGLTIPAGCGSDVPDSGSDGAG